MPGPITFQVGDCHFSM